MTRWPSVISQPAAPRCVSRTSAPGPLRFTRARAMTASAAAAGAALARLDQLDPDVVGRPHERDARPVRDLDGPLQEASAQALEPLDVGLEVRGVEPEVLEPVVGARVPRPEALARARTRDGHAHSAVLALAADEAVAEDARLVAHDLEVEGPHVPLRGLPRVGRLQVDVVDAERHDAPPLEGALGRRGPSPATACSAHLGPAGMWSRDSYIHPFGRCGRWDSSTDGQCSSPARRAASAPPARTGSRPTAPGSCWPISIPAWRRWPMSSARPRSARTSRGARTSSEWSRSRTGAGVGSTSSSTTRASSACSRCWT